MILNIAAENAGRRLDKFLLAYLNAAPRSLIYKLLRKKRIKLNGARALGSEMLAAGDELQFFLSEETLTSCRAERHFAQAAPLTGIIFEDADYLIVDKPAGLPSQGGMKQKDNLLARVLYYLSGTVAADADFTPALCNRLDVNTTGLVVCGKSLHALQRMNALFAARAVKKEYLAVVYGVAGHPGAARSLENFYRKDTRTNTAHILAAGDVKILTDFTVLAATEDFSLLNVSPITGRSHQIRVHLAHIGHPLVGDKKYPMRPMRGATPSTDKSAFSVRLEAGYSTAMVENSGLDAPAQLLHCHKLTLPDGTVWEAPPPEIFVKFFPAFGKDG